MAQEAALEEIANGRLQRLFAYGRPLTARAWKWEIQYFSIRLLTAGARPGGVAQL